MDKGNLTFSRFSLDFSRFLRPQNHFLHFYANFALFGLRFHAPLTKGQKFSLFAFDKQKFNPFWR